MADVQIEDASTGTILPCAPQVLSADLTLETGNTYFAGDLEVADGVTLTIEDGAELILL